MREITRDGVHYTLLGTAHVSRASVEAVQAMSRDGDYDAIAVELCPARLEALEGRHGWRDLDLYRIIRDGKAGLVMANLALSGYQRRIAEQFGIEPGAELKAAAEAARKQDIELQLIDRDLATTLKRTYRRVPWYKRLYLTAGLVLSSFSNEDIDEDSIEKLKEGDILESTFTEFAEQSPEIYEALIAERDRFMAARLRADNAGAEGRRVLAVVGAGHLDGLARALEGSDVDPAAEVATLSTQPPKARWPRFIPWVILALVATGFYLGFRQSPALFWELVVLWVAINGGLAALGAALAKGHPLTILSGLVAAPLTSLNPMVAAGMVTGLVQSWVRKPTGADLERLRDDATTLKGWYANPATRILLVFFLSNLGSAIGTWVAGFRIFEKVTGA
ncbi:TraB/GumN family protein [Marinihelvus fidelis]|uniref:TraB/GumN family protein n=1 Tax=Marinihelvus fidelis TaxID=2613842 RepID=A0A5N0TI78_9GAMM|nr:TraB/GumN family protein [Marinihelvus fidelis]